jgi:hypothetical protein
MASRFSPPDLRCPLKCSSAASRLYITDTFTSSEDIDIVIDKALLGFAGDESPEQAPSNKQRRARLENLMTAARAWVQGTLQPALAQRLTATLGSAGWKLEVDPDMADGQCLLFHYASVFPPGSAGYIPPQVKIELGARSDDGPAEPKVLVSYVLERFPALGREPSVAVRVFASSANRGSIIRRTIPAPSGSFH